MASTSVCTICLEALLRHEEPMCATVPCGHAFHECCLKKWANEQIQMEDDETTPSPSISCPVCNTNVSNVMKIFLNSKSGVVDDSLTGKELESWRKEYDDETKADRLKLHSDILHSNKQVIDEIFEKQKILETYEEGRFKLDHARKENHQLRRELFKQIMKHEAEMRRMESNKQIITEVLERNEKALQDLKSTREENLDLKKELLRNIMVHQTDMKKLEATKKAMTNVLEKHEVALLSLKESREENLSLKKELVQHLHTHKQEMVRLDSHKEALADIVHRHEENVRELDDLRKENLELKEELIEALIKTKTDAQKMAKAREWLDYYQEELSEYRQDHAELKRVRAENYRLVKALKEKHDVLATIHKDKCIWIEKKMDLLVVIGQLGLLGYAMLTVE